MNPENIPLLCSKVASICGMGNTVWVWLGVNNVQLSSIFGAICTLIAILSYLKGKK